MSSLLMQTVMQASSQDSCPCLHTSANGFVLCKIIERNDVSL